MLRPEIIYYDKCGASDRRHQQNDGILLKHLLPVHTSSIVSTSNLVTQFSSGIGGLQVVVIPAAVTISWLWSPLRGLHQSRPRSLWFC
jgi:hypothetical protein